jgi:predicted nucleic acid-binding protein
MAMTAGSPIFVDTNVLVYFTFTHFAEHQLAQQRLAECESLPAVLWAAGRCYREFLAVTTPPELLDSFALHYFSGHASARLRKSTRDRGG